MNDLRKIINDLLKIDNPRRSYAMIETLILNVLGKYIREQNKEFLTNSMTKSIHGGIYEFDGLAPLGFDNYEGETVIEIKLYTRKESILQFSKRNIERILQAGRDVKNIILCVTLDLAQEEKQKLISRLSIENLNLFIWDMKDIEELLNRYPDYVSKITDNLSAVMIDTMISKSINNDDNNWKTKRNQYLDNLRRSYYDDNLVMFLGAGISMDAKIPTWDQLLSDLVVSLIGKKLESHSINLTENEKELIISKIKKMNGDSPLLQARYVRTGLEDVFTEILTEILYKKCINESKVLNEIAQICLPIRGGTGIKAVVTYNFDDLVEYNLKKLRIKHKSIYREGEMPCKNELGIFHVHGFLPRDVKKYENLSKGLLVFSEEGYHNLILDPYNWSNLVQLNYLRENTCLFIGLSMTDPNLRRILDIAVRKQESDSPSKHYAILKRDVINIETITDTGINKHNIEKFNVTNQNLQEEFFKELGVNIIWIDDFDEIPAILKQIKE